MSDDGTMVIVGAALTGAKAAETLREEGYEGRVVLIGDEPVRPYERPPLSKDYLRGESDREKVFVHEPAFYEARDIELITGGPATAIAPGTREVVLGGGETLRYDALLISTGAAPRRLPIPGADLDGVLTLRTLADSEYLRERLSAAGRLAVIGAGWIGCEVAASARQMGLEVTLLEHAQVPLEAVLGHELGAFYRDVHLEHSVRFMAGAAVEAIEGDGAAARVRLSGGEAIDCDLVLIGVGVAPRTELAQAAGLDVDNGILVDATLESSAPGVFAAGDVANAEHPFFGRRVRVEHWANALNQGPAAARNMLGAGIPYDRLPYFFSDQYDVGMEYSGLAERGDEVVIRGDTAKREFVAFWLHDDRVVAGMNVNVWDVNEAVQALIRSRAPVDRGALADPDVPLESLAEAPRTE